VEETRYGLRVEIPAAYEQAVERATAALKAQGFGVLTTIDVQQTLKQKPDRNFRIWLFSAHVPGLNPPAFSRSAFSRSGPSGVSSEQHVGT
jgi:hypothetical protein